MGQWQRGLHPPAQRPQKNGEVRGAAGRRADRERQWRQYSASVVMNLVFIPVDLEDSLMYVHLIRATTKHVSLTYAAMDTFGEQCLVFDALI